MKSKFAGIWLAFCLSFGSFSEIGHCGTVLVQGDASDLPAVVHSDVYETQPVVLFTTDLPPHIFDDENRSGLTIRQIDGFIFKTGDQRDMAIEIAASQIIVVTDLKDEAEIKIPVPEDGEYEIYLAAFKLNTPVVLYYSVSGADLKQKKISHWRILDDNGAYVKFAESILQGKKPVSLRLKLRKRAGTQDLIREMKVFFVKKESREKVEKAILDKLAGTNTRAGYFSTNPKGSFRNIPSVPTSVKLFLRSKQTKPGSAAGLGPLKTALVRINERIYRFGNFQKNGALFSMPLRPRTGSQRYSFEFLENPYYEAGWIIFDPAGPRREVLPASSPQIHFQSINPTKCLVRIKGATAPFWLVFNEGFHKKWVLYRPIGTDAQLLSGIDQVPGVEYPRLRAEEKQHFIRFTPEDMRYLSRTPLACDHLIVNGYANGWYIDPAGTGLGTDFDLVIFFQPQAHFYTGIASAVVTLFLAAIALLLSRCLRSLKK